MRVLWFVNVLVPKAAQKMELLGSNAGGWIVGQISQLEGSELELIVACTHEDITQSKTCVCGGVTYWTLPRASADYAGLLKTVKPDILHIFGTESAHSNALVKLFDPAKTLVSIQGLAASCAESYFANMPQKYHTPNAAKRFLKKLLPGDVLCEDYAAMKKAAELEQETLNIVQNAAGRTDWDKRCALEINSRLRYFHLGEILRPAFYEQRWSAENCERHTAFFSQATYPIKGLHLALPSIARLAKKYPDFKVFVGGRAPYVVKNPLIQLGVDTMFEYQAYLKRQMKAYGVEKNVIFLGNLDEEQMCAQYRNANVFWSASSIENSPNSLGEAMLLGMPIVSSDVGGVSSMVSDQTEALLYAFGDEDKLFAYTDRIFSEPEYAKKMGQRARTHALSNHDRAAITQELRSIYATIYHADRLSDFCK